VAGRENGVDLVFTTNTETGKTTELDKEPHINVSFYNGLNVPTQLPCLPETTAKSCIGRMGLDQWSGGIE
jgi:hypothetical protein